MYLKDFVKVRPAHLLAQTLRRKLSYGFSLPDTRNLNEILKTDLVEGKSKSEVTNIWSTFHEDKEGVHGNVLDGEEGKKILARAGDCPFFIQPVFRDGGHFMMLSQFQSPSFFFLTYLEHYKKDPNHAQPLVTFSLFTDLRESHDLSLVRYNIVNKGITDDDGMKVMTHMLDAYRDDDEFEKVKIFNSRPEDFNIENFISEMNQKWT